MKVYYHHVGQAGASEDFPKTIFSTVSLRFVQKYLPPHSPNNAEYLAELSSLFPEGNFNCWGVPAGARSVIKNLKVNDFVFLIETTAGHGSIPAMGKVLAFWNIEMRDLSLALWGNHKFPFIFFFYTEILNLTWTHFINQVGYRENFRPSGNFYSIKAERLERFGGSQGYINFIRKRYASDKFQNSTREPSESYEQIKKRLEDSMPDELDDIENLKSSYQPLDQTEQETIVKSRIGQGRFRNFLLAYWKGCAVTKCTEQLILRASHIKPWRDSTNEERLNPFNGLLLIPNLDALFDRGMISFTDDGIMLFSTHLNEVDKSVLGLVEGMKIDRLSEKHSEFLQYHRNYVFKA